MVYHELRNAIRARYIRIRPTAWHIHISTRVEVYGCREAFPVTGGKNKPGLDRVFKVHPNNFKNLFLYLKFAKKRMERKRKIDPFKSKNQLGFNYFMNSLNTPGKTL